MGDSQVHASSDLTYIGETSPHLSCPVCLSPFLVPTTASCSHTFCKECIVEAVNQTSRCPVDRRPLDVDDLQPADPVIRSLVGDLKVECVNKDAGCTKQMARDSLTRHLEEECVYAKVICPFDGCGVQLPLHELLEHQDLHRAAEMDDFDQQVSQPERESSRNQHKTISRSNGLGRIRRTRVIVDFINSLANHLNAASGSSRSCARSRSRSPPSGEFVWGSSTSSGHWRSDARASNPEPETPFVVRAKYQYDAEDVLELSFNEGDLLCVLSVDDDEGWYQGNHLDAEERRREGTFAFPRYFVEIIPDFESQNAQEQNSAGHSSESVSAQVFASSDDLIIAHAKALVTYIAEDEDQFDFQQDDIIAITSFNPLRGYVLDEQRRQDAFGKTRIPPELVEILN